MATIRMTRGKFDGITACADARGVIAALAMDQRGSLRKAIAAARGEGGTASDDDVRRFKMAVTRVLTPHASAILMDPEYGLEALARRAPGTGVLLAYEQTGYDPTIAGRLPGLLPTWSARRLVAAGANAVKLLLYYNPVDQPAINDVKHAFIERVGAECAALDVPFFLEPVTYDDAVGDEHGLAFARRKPEYVIRTIAEFTRPRYGVDVLKVEVPVTLAFVAGTRAFGGTAAYTHAEALGYFRQAASAATRPFIYLSAGVSHAAFLEELELAAEAGVAFAGVLCGRATWQEGIPVYAREGAGALEAWLEDRGVAHIEALNARLAAARPWWTTLGGRENIEVVGDAPVRAALGSAAS
jgi:tagatose 1,6-diphosphate aldolase